MPVGGLQVVAVALPPSGLKRSVWPTTLQKTVFFSFMSPMKNTGSPVARSSLIFAISILTASLRCACRSRGALCTLITQIWRPVARCLRRTTGCLRCHFTNGIVIVCLAVASHTLVRQIRDCWTEPVSPSWVPGQAA